VEIERLRLPVKKSPQKQARVEYQSKKNTGGKPPSWAEEKEGPRWEKNQTPIPKKETRLVAKTAVVKDKR